MTDRELDELEREVAASRARLSSNLSILSNPDTYTDLKYTIQHQAETTKDQATDAIKERAGSLVASLVEDIKARAAANPAATLAIGAGIAWRLAKHPPVSAALIGLGLFSLLRTPPQHSADYLELARERLAEQAGDAASVVTDKIAEASIAVKDKAGELADQASAQAKDTMHRLAHTGEAMVEGAGSRAERLIESAGAKGRDFYDRAEHELEPYMERMEPRNALLVGAAGLAVAAAIGIAYQRDRA